MALGGTAMREYGSTPEQIGAALDYEEDDQLAQEAEDARLDADVYDPYDIIEDPLAGYVDPTGGF